MDVSTHPQLIYKLFICFWTVSKFVITKKVTKIILRSILCHYFSIQSKKMLSPKMQRTIRINENQLIMLSERAHYDHSMAGYLHKRSADNSKWQLRWFVLYQVKIICLQLLLYCEYSVVIIILMSKFSRTYNYLEFINDQCFRKLILTIKWHLLRIDFID